MSHQVLKLLFKSFLRWNRQTHIRNSVFSIDLNSLGLGRYIPPDHSPIIHMQKGVQGALFHIFRLPPPIIPVKQNNTNTINDNNNSKLSTVDARQDDIQLGFQVLRELNMIGSVILKNYNQKIERLKYCYPDLSDDIDSTVHHHPPYHIHKNNTIHKDNDDITAESSSSSVVKYRVGQTIQHKVSKIRGVVIGWDIDEETKTQRIEILLDQLDFNHWIDSSLVHSVMSTKSFVRSLRRVLHIPISDVTLVTDDNMKRILNEDIRFFFYGYSSLLNRYIPNRDLTFWYSHDMDYFNSQFESHMVIGNHEGNVYKNSLENVYSSLSSITSSIQNVFDRHFYSGNSMITHLNASSTQDSHQHSLISSWSKPILSKHLNPSSLNNPSITSVSSRSSSLFPSSTSSATPSITVGVLTDAQINMKFITDNILDEVRSYMTGFTKAIKSINSHPPSSVTTTDYKDRYTIKHFDRDVIMKNQLIFKNCSVENNSYTDITDFYRGFEKGHNSKSIDEQLTQHSRHDVNEIFNAVGYLVNCFHAVDQLLQLRFQAKGMGFIDGLVVKSMNRPSSLSSSVSSSSSPSSSIPSTSLQSSSLFNHHEIHVEPSQEKDGYCDTINEESKHPPALYQVGQVVRHKIHGYHSVIIGFEQRSTATRFLRTTSLDLGLQQPIYMVIPDEIDVENILSESHWPFLNNIDTTEPYPVAQEHLEISTTRSQIRHKRINEYFLGYDINTRLYRLPHKLRYCFPNNSAFSSLPIVYTTPSVASDDIDKATQDKDEDCNDEGANALLSVDVDVCSSGHDDDKGELVNVDEQSVEYLEKQVLKEQSIVYNKIDCFIVDLWRTLKTSFAKSNSTSSSTTTSCGTVSVNDLMVLLRHADSLENSLHIEGLLSLIWLTHENSDLNKLMRLSMINAQCGNVDNAITIINKVIERDPTYVEAHTKRAIYLYTLKKFQDSAISAKKALDLFPGHLEALSVLSLCRLHQDKPNETIREVTKLIGLHPWAFHLRRLIINLDRKLNK